MCVISFDFPLLWNQKLIKRKSQQLRNYELGIVFPLKDAAEVNKSACYERPPRRYGPRDSPWVSLHLLEIMVFDVDRVSFWNRYKRNHNISNHKQHDLLCLISLLIPTSSICWFQDLLVPSVLSIIR